MYFSNEVDHSEHLIVRGPRPFNAEPLASALVEFKYTPEELVYCRNHSAFRTVSAYLSVLILIVAGPVDDINVESYNIIVDGLVKERLTLKWKELKDSFPHATVVAALQVSIVYSLLRSHLIFICVLVCWKST